jgi:hypothetical protein
MRIPDVVTKAIMAVADRCPRHWVSPDTEALRLADTDTEEAILAHDAGAITDADLRAACVRWYKVHTGGWR